MNGLSRQIVLLAATGLVAAIAAGCVRGPTGVEGAGAGEDGGDRRRDVSEPTDADGDVEPDVRPDDAALDVGPDGRSDGAGGRDGQSEDASPDSGSDGDGGQCAKTDRPDPEFKDADCDGIDGDRDRSVFVSTAGDASNPGTLPKPLDSIGDAIRKVKNSTSKEWVLIEGASFEETVELSEGVHIAGGYDFQWQRSESLRTQIKGGNPALKASGIAKRTVVSSVKVVPTDKVGTGETVVTAHLKNSDGVELRN
ncbi:MAG: hypothetical protein ABEL76_01415, partial [Bradymonadaceae bacterium]